MPSLKDFVAALQAGWFPALAALIGCSIVVAGDWFKVPYLTDPPQWLLTTAVTVGVFAASILLANVVYIPIRLWGWVSFEMKRRKFRSNLAKEIQGASYREKEVLAYLISARLKSFVAPYTNGRLAPLVTKGFVIRVPGTHSMLEWPHMVQEDVWNYLERNKHMFVMEGAENQTSPFDLYGRWS